MKTSSPLFRWVSVLALVLGGMLLGGWGVQALSRVAAPAALGSGFSYQGRLADTAGDAITSVCTLTFGLYDADSGGNQIGSNDVIAGVAVADGLFTVTLNDSNEFGDDAFNGQPRWLEIAVQCAGDGSATVLGRQPINPVPYALFAERFAGYGNVIVVAKSNGDFDSVAEAVAAIGVDPRYPAAGISNRYLVYVAPGIYTDGRVVMKPYVDLEGAGEGLTVLAYPAVSAAQDADAAVLVAAGNSEVRHLTITNTHSSAGAYTSAIYANTGQVFRLTHVTASSVATGGSRSRALVMRGVDTFLDGSFLTLYSTGGSVSAIALDVADGQGQIEHFAFYAAASPAANIGINLDGAQNFNLSHGRIITTGPSINDFGVRLLNVNEVVVDSVMLDLTNTNGFMSGYYATGSAGLTFRNSQVYIDGSSDTISGITTIDSSIDIDGGLVELVNSGSVQGITNGAYSGSGHTYRISRTEVNQIGDGGSALWFDGSVYVDVIVEDSHFNFDLVSADGSNSGVNLTTDGEFSLSNVGIRIDGEANFITTYGLRATNGTVNLHQVTIDALADGTNQVMGLFVTGDGILQAENVRVNANQGGASGVYGVWVNSANVHTLRDVTTLVEGMGYAYGILLSQGRFTTSNLATTVKSFGESTVTYGLYCGNGPFDSAVISLNEATILVFGADSASDTSYSFGVYGPGCRLDLSNALVHVSGFGTYNYGLGMLNNSGLVLSNSVVRVNAEINSGSVADSNGVYLQNTVYSKIMGSTIDVNSVLASSQVGLNVETAPAGPTQTVVVQNSIVSGFIYAVYSVNNNQVDFHGSVLEGGSLFASFPSDLQCTGVTRVIFGISGFVAGPVNCP